MDLAVVVRWGAEEAASAARDYWFQNPVSPYASRLRGIHQVFASYRFARAADLDGYLDLLAQYPRLIEEITSYLGGQVRRGIAMPKDELAAAMQLVRGFRVEGPRSVFAVDSSRLRAIDPALASRFRADVATEIDERVNPALDRLVAYLGGRYASHAPTAVGLAQYPGGEAFYRHEVSRSLTFEMTPEEIHQVGLNEVARISAELESIRRTTGFRGDRAAFLRFLRTDPRFVPTSEAAIRQRMLGFVNALVPRLGQAFAVVPTTPYDVRRLDPALEGGMTFGFYRAPTEADSTGVYFFNGSNLEHKSHVWYEGLAYHELMPGHHFQSALMRSQLARLHPLRREFNSTAFGEGWAEYAADVAGELGAYADPYDRAGRLASQLMTAVRLVLDTGMNLLGWSRERAMQYMRENTLMSEPEIASETLRYCCDIPSQALGYRMGMLEIRKLRRKAETALGRQFVLRNFHRVILDDGPLPFSALEQRVDDYIARHGRPVP